MTDLLGLVQLSLIIFETERLLMVSFLNGSVLLPVLRLLSIFASVWLAGARASTVTTSRVVTI
jgi:hypothetical protein